MRVARAAAAALFASAALARGAPLRVEASPGVWTGELPSGNPGAASFEQSVEKVMDDGAAQTGFRLDLAFPADRAWDVQDLAPPMREPARPLRKFWIGASSAVAILGSAENALSEVPRYPFHFTNEGWLGQNTYAGGADKASHFASYYNVTKIMTALYGGLGLPVDDARLLGTGVAWVAGLATELGDAGNKYGFSYEDLVSDTLGVVTALATAHYGMEDLVGFRIGVVPAPKIYEHVHGGLGKDYSEEIYTADLKIAGLARLQQWRPGVARFLLVSMTYGSKGYPYAPPDLRERQVGFEVGLNMSEILRAVGVPEEKWWGKALILGFDTVRFPYTAVGFRYDLNRGKWHGPDIGDTFPIGAR